MAIIQDTYPLAPAIAFPGMLSDVGDKDTITGINTHATLAIPFGSAVARAATGSKMAAEPVEAILDTILGIHIYSTDYAPSALADSGYTFAGLFVGAVKPKNTMAILRRGRIWVICENGCTRGQRLHVRAIIAGAEISGALRSATDGTDTRDCTGQGEWLTAASAGAIAELEVDFVNLAS